jgi:hypothetical protein
MRVELPGSSEVLAALKRGEAAPDRDSAHTPSVWRNVVSWRAPHPHRVGQWQAPHSGRWSPSRPPTGREAASSRPAWPRNSLRLPFIDRLIAPTSRRSAERAAAAERSARGPVRGGARGQPPPGAFSATSPGPPASGAMMAPDPHPRGRRRHPGAHRGPGCGTSPGAHLESCWAGPGRSYLASRPGPFTSAWTAPLERRVAWAAAYETSILDAARSRQSETDKARTVFVKRLYRVDPARPGSTTSSWTRPCWAWIERPRNSSAQPWPSSRPILSKPARVGRPAVRRWFDPAAAAWGLGQLERWRSSPSSPCCGSIG